MNAVLHRFTKAHQGDIDYAKIVPQRFKLALSPVYWGNSDAEPVLFRLEAVLTRVFMECLRLSIV